MDATANPTSAPKPPTLRQLQARNADALDFEELIEVFESTKALAQGAAEWRLLSQLANDLVNIATLADRAKDYQQGKGKMVEASGLQQLARTIREESEKLRTKARALTPPPTITPVIPTPPPPTKNIIEIKTLSFASDEEISRWINDGWERVKIERETHPVTGGRGWVILLERQKPAEALAPIPATAEANQPTRPTTIPEAAKDDDTQPLKPIVAPIVPAVAAELPANIAELADHDLPAAIVAARTANIPLEAMMRLYTRQTLAVGRATYQRLQDDRDARPMRPLGFIAPHMLTQITIEDGAA